MTVLIRPPLWGAQKPPPSAGLRGDAALWRGLENLLLLTEGSGAPRQAAPSALGRWPVATLGTGVTWAPGAGGAALAFPGTADVNLNNSGTDAYSVSTGGYSLVARVYLPTTSLKGIMLDGGTSVNLGVGSGDADTNGNELLALYSAVRWVPSGVSIGTGWHTLGLTVTTSGGAGLWRDGRLVYSDTGSAPLSFSGTRRLGSEDGTGRFLASGCRVDWAGWWRRTLTPPEMERLALAPADLLAPPAPTQRYWLVTSSAVTAYRDTQLRFKLARTVYRDTQTRFRLALTTYRDTQARFKLAATNYRDTALRFRLIVTAYRDVQMRFRLAATAYRDSRLRFVLATSIAAYRDTQVRFKLAATSYRDTALHFVLGLVGYRDTRLRFLLGLVAYRDVQARFRLAVRQWRDTRFRFAFGIIATTTYRDTRLRFHLATTPFVPSITGTLPYGASAAPTYTEAA